VSIKKGARAACRSLPSRLLRRGFVRVGRVRHGSVAEVQARLRGVSVARGRSSGAFAEAGVGDLLEAGERAAVCGGRTGARGEGSRSRSERARSIVSGLGSDTGAPEAVEKSGSGVGDENARASMEREGASRVVRSACKPAPPRDLKKHSWFPRRTRRPARARSLFAGAVGARAASRRRTRTATMSDERAVTFDEVRAATPLAVACRVSRASPAPILPARVASRPIAPRSTDARTFLSPLRPRSRTASACWTRRSSTRRGSCHPARTTSAIRWRSSTTSSRRSSRRWTSRRVSSARSARHTV